MLIYRASSPRITLIQMVSEICTDFVGFCRNLTSGSTFCKLEEKNNQLVIVFGFCANRRQTKNKKNHCFQIFYIYCFLIRAFSFQGISL